MAKKMELLSFYIKDLKTPAVNILKQDALSIGAELATPSGVIICEHEQYDCLLIGTRKHIEILSKKELAQPFGLKKLALELQQFLKVKDHPVKIMGIINANDDSFFSGSRFMANDAVEQIKEMIFFMPHWSEIAITVGSIGIILFIFRLAEISFSISKVSEH